MEDKINDIVTSAFDAEEQTSDQASEQVVEQASDQVETPAEEKSAEVAEKEEAVTEESTTEESAVEEEHEQVAAPKQLKGDFVKSHWEGLDKETKDELARLAAENERNYLRSNEAEHNAKMFRKTIEPVQGYISEVAQTSNIPESEVIRNCVNIVQSLNDNPTLTARQMIAGGLIKFEDPVAVINEIAHTYGIDVKGDMKGRDIPEGYYNSAAQARYEARQAKYVKPEEVDTDVQNAITDYVENTPGIKALVDSPEWSDKFIRQIQMERQADPNSSDITIINRAAELFDPMVAKLNRIATKADEVMKITNADQKAELQAQKMQKVVAPKASNPANTEEVDAPIIWDSNNINKESAKSAEKSVREALRAMGLDD